MKNLNVIFMGTPDISVKTLEALIEHTNVVLVVTAPDAPVGRKKELMPSAVKKVALENNLEVFSPVKIRNNYEIIKKLNPDIIITYAYGQIISEDILNIPRLGCVNIHASLLPKYRGGAPIHYALMNGEDKTGITLMYMDKGMDTGDMIVSDEITIEESDNLISLSEKLAVLGSEMIIKYLPSIIDGTAPRIKQEEANATFAYAKNINRELEHIDFNKTNNEVYCLIRALYPYAYFKFEENEIKILECEKINAKGKTKAIIDVDKNSFTIMCKEGAVRVTKIKPFGKKEMLVKDYFNGYKKENMLNKEVE